LRFGWRQFAQQSANDFAYPVEFCLNRDTQKRRTPIQRRMLHRSLLMKVDTGNLKFWSNFKREWRANMQSTSSLRAAGWSATIWRSQCWRGQHTSRRLGRAALRRHHHGCDVDRCIAIGQQQSRQLSPPQKLRKIGWNDRRCYVSNLSDTRWSIVFCSCYSCCRGAVSTWRVGVFMSIKPGQLQFHICFNPIACRI